MHQFHRIRIAYAPYVHPTKNFTDSFTHTLFSHKNCIVANYFTIGEREKLFSVTKPILQLQQQRSSHPNNSIDLPLSSSIKNNSTTKEFGVTWQIGNLFEANIVWILFGYFALNGLIRASLGAPPELDEAEQFAISTHYSFGYGPHPPLYQWIQTTAFHMFGVNYIAIAVPKNLILFGTYATLFLLGMHLTDSRMIAAIGSFGLLFSVNFAWESQHDQSHTVSNTFLTVTTVYLFFKALEKAQRLHYIGLGLAIGLWALAKYNFVFPLTILTVIAVLTPEGRNFIKSPWIFATILLAVCIPAAHYGYILNNVAEATTKVSKLGLNETGFLQNRFLGTIAFFKAFIGVHAGWLILLAGLAIMTRNDATHLNHPLNIPRQTIELIPFKRRQIIFTRLVCAIYLLLLAFVLVAGISRYRDHWMQPAAVFAPLLLAILFQKFLTRQNFNRAAFLAALIMPIITIAYIFNNLGIGTERRDAALPAPMSIQHATSVSDTQDIPFVIADKRHRYRWLTSGHLRSFFPNVTTIFEPTATGLKDREFWLLWRSETPQLNLFKNIYIDLVGVDARSFSQPVEISHFRPKELGEFAGTKWWISRHTPK